MKAGPGILKLTGGLGGLVACGASGLVVATGTRPDAAPLHPSAHLDASTASTVSTSSGQNPGLSIPVTPLCQGAGNRGVTTSVDAGVRQVLSRLRQTSDQGQRQQLLQQAMSSLTADERQQLTAALQTAAASGGGKAARGAAGCRGSSAQPVAASDQGILPDVVDAAPSATPVTVTAVS